MVVLKKTLIEKLRRQRNEKKSLFDLDIVARITNKAIDYCFYLICFSDDKENDVIAYLYGEKSGVTFITLNELKRCKVDDKLFELDEDFKEIKFDDFLKQRKYEDMQKFVDSL